MEVSPYFRVGEKKAKEIIDTIKKAVNGWDKSAEKLGISRGERDIMEKAFRYTD